MQQGDYEKALECFTDAISLDDEEDVLYRCASPRSLGTLVHPSAFFFNSSLIATARSYPHCSYSNRCAAYCKLERWPEAVKDAEKVVELKPEWAKVRRRRR
jgi:tetratricopeptide (TPR) repeat protein